MSNQRGFTLLEVLVATTVMAIAVAGLLASLSTSLRNGARVTDADRASMVARNKMDELLLQAKLPHNIEVAGPFAPAETGWEQSGWRAVVQPYEMPPGAQPGWFIVERIRLQIWWTSGGNRRSYPLDAYRQGRMIAGDVMVRP